MTEITDAMVRIAVEAFDSTDATFHSKMRAALSAAEAARVVGATHRHIKRGSTYSIVGDFEIQASRSIVEGNIVRGYRCAETGKLWGREVSEFDDGRFELLAASPAAPVPAEGEGNVPEISFGNIEKSEQIQHGWRPTHRHVKRGSTYQKIGVASLQSSWPISEGCPVVIYQAENGSLWARPEGEFDDGRFDVLPTPPREGE